MTSTYKLVNQFKEVCESFLEDWDYVGIRVQEQPEQIGEALTHLSSVWTDGTDTSETINGVSAIDFKKYMSHVNSDNFSGYYGDYVIILGCNYATYGNDDCEIIMQNPTVLQSINI